MAVLMEVTRGGHILDVLKVESTVFTGRLHVRYIFVFSFEYLKSRVTITEWKIMEAQV